MRVGSGNFWQFLRRAGGATSAAVASVATDVANARTVLGLGSLATVNSVGTAQIDNDAVTYAKIQNITTARLLGRTTGGAGDVEEVSVGYGLSLASLALASSLQLIVVQDQKASGTNGGSSVAGAYATRTLNTVVGNTITGASLAANQVTLPAGTYLLLAVAPGYATGDFKAKIRNVTDGTNVAFGTSAVTGISGLEIVSTIFGIVVIAAPKAFDIQMRPSSSQATNGLGIAVSFGDVEVYSQFMALRIA